MYSKDCESINTEIFKCQASLTTQKKDFTWGLEKLPLDMDINIDFEGMIKDSISPQISIPDSLDFGIFTDELKDYVISKGASYINSQIENLVGSFSLGTKEMRVFQITYNIESQVNGEIFAKVAS